MAEPSHHHRCAGIRLGTNSPDPGSALRPCSKTRLCTDKLVIFTMMLLLIKYLYSIDRKQDACKAKSEVIFLLLALVTPELMYVQSLSLHVCFSHLSAEGGTFFCAYLKERGKKSEHFKNIGTLTWWLSRLNNVWWQTAGEQSYTKVSITSVLDF